MSHFKHFFLSILQVSGLGPLPLIGHHTLQSGDAPPAHDTFERSPISNDYAGHGFFSRKAKPCMRPCTEFSSGHADFQSMRKYRKWLLANDETNEHKLLHTTCFNQPGCIPWHTESQQRATKPLACYRS